MAIRKRFKSATEAQAERDAEYRLDGQLRLLYLCIKQRPWSAKTFAKEWVVLEGLVKHTGLSAGEYFAKNIHRAQPLSIR